MKTRLLATVAALGALAASGTAQAQIKIGAILSISGPAAAMGVGYKGAFDFFPTEIAGQKVEYIIRDDATDANTALHHRAENDLGGPCRRLHRPVADRRRTPRWRRSPTRRMCRCSRWRRYEYDPHKQPYTFNDAQPLSLMVDAVFKYMQQHGVKTIGYIGFSDGWGDQVLGATKQSAAERRHQDPRRRTLRPHRYLRARRRC